MTVVVTGIRSRSIGCVVGSTTSMTAHAWSVRKRLGLVITCRAPKLVGCVGQPRRGVDAQRVAGTGDRDVEQPLLLGEPVVAGQRHVGGERAVDSVQHVHRRPLEALRRVDGRQGEVVLVEVRLRARSRRWRWPGRSSVRRRTRADRAGEPRSRRAGRRRRRGAASRRSARARAGASLRGTGRRCSAAGVMALGVAEQAQRVLQRRAGLRRGRGDHVGMPPASAPTNTSREGAGVCLADRAMQGQQPVPGDLVGRVGRRPAARPSKVAHVRGVDELDAAVLDERDRCAP